MFNKRNNKMKRMTTLAVMLALIVPALVTATVVISYTYPVNSNNATPDIYLIQGENYYEAQELGLFSANSVSSPASYVPAETIYVNSTSGSTATYLLNVLEIYNTSVTGFKGQVNVTITSNLNSNIVLYYSASPLTFSYASSSISGSSVTKGQTVHVSITGTGDVLYIGFAITTQSTSTASAGSFTIQYTVS